MKQLSQDIRERIVKGYADCDDKDELAERFSVSLSSVKRILKLFEQTGAVTPRTRPGRTGKLDKRACDLLCGWLKENNDLTLDELRVKLLEHGYSVCVSAVCRRLKRLNVTYKKNDARKRAKAS